MAPAMGERCDHVPESVEAFLQVPLLSQRERAVKILACFMSFHRLVSTLLQRMLLSVSLERDNGVRGRV